MAAATAADVRIWRRPWWIWIQFQWQVTHESTKIQHYNSWKKRTLLLFNNIPLQIRQQFLSYTHCIFSQIPPSNIVLMTTLISANSNSCIYFSTLLSMLRHPTLASPFKTCATTLSVLSSGVALHALSIKLSLNTNPFSYLKTRFPV